jgi:hypothetical protein
MKGNRFPTRREEPIAISEAKHWMSEFLKEYNLLENHWLHRFTCIECSFVKMNWIRLSTSKKTKKKSTHANTFRWRSCPQGISTVVGTELPKAEERVCQQLEEKSMKNGEKWENTGRFHFLLSFNDFICTTGGNGSVVAISCGVHTLESSGNSANQRDRFHSFLNFVSDL